MTVCAALGGVPVLFLGCVRTGKRSGQYPSGIQKPDSAAFAHATHPPILSFNHYKATYLRGHIRSKAISA